MAVGSTPRPRQLVSLLKSIPGVLNAFLVLFLVMLIFAIIAVLAGILAAVFPARRAARLNVLRALQYE